MYALTQPSLATTFERTKVLILERLTAIIADPATPVREVRMTGAILLRFIASIETLNQKQPARRTRSETPSAPLATPASPAPAPTPQPPSETVTPLEPTPRQSAVHASNLVRPPSSPSPIASARTLLNRAISSMSFPAGG